MGERKGTNKYYPPDYDPKAGGLNKWQGTHALRERARKISQGIIIIRFEMPYNIWCDGCNNHIGMGVRYNSEKTKVGMYYTTPVYQFKMKCHLCDNYFVIKTDPGNLDYIIISGARRQENRWDPTTNEQIVPETKEVQKRLFDDSMFKLEHQSGDQNTAESAKPRLAKLFARNEDTWGDVYTANQMLRKDFRKKSVEIKNSAAKDKSILSKFNLDIPILPERDEDKRVASLLSMKLKPVRDIDESTNLARKKMIIRSSLPSSFTPMKESKALKVLSKDLSKCVGIVKKTTGRKDETVTKNCDAVGQGNGDVEDDKSLVKEESQSVDENEENLRKKLKCTEGSVKSLVGDYSSSGDSE